MSAPEFRKPGFGRGLRWLPAAAELLFSNFGPLAGLAALWLLVSMIAVVPVIGQLAIMLLTPLLTAGAIAAFAQVSGGRRPVPTTLFAAFGRPDLRNRLLGIGAFGILGSILALLVLSTWLGSQAGPEQILAAQQSPEAMTELIGQLSFSPLLIVAAGILAVVMAAMYFAIPLVIFHDVSTAGALATSLRAMLANWAAFLGFGLVVLIGAIALGVVFSLVTIILNLALGSASLIFGQVLLMLTAMLAQVLMAGTQWVAFADVFGSPSGGDGNDQLLA